MINNSFNKTFHPISVEHGKQVLYSRSTYFSLLEIETNLNCMEDNKITPQWDNSINLEPLNYAQACQLNLHLSDLMIRVGERQNTDW